jgi:glycosyltransferase involved in cell wall biosynthesis
VTLRVFLVISFRHLLIGRTAGVQVTSRFVAQIERGDPLSDDDARIALVPNIIRPASTPFVGPVKLRPKLVDDVTSSAGDHAAHLAWLPSKPFILFVGAFHPYKHIESLLSACSRRNAPQPLVVGTSWPDSPNVLLNGVTVLTDIPNLLVHRIWEGSLLSVAPSLLPATFGGAVSEASRLGRPVASRERDAAAFRRDVLRSHRIGAGETAAAG